MKTWKGAIAIAIKEFLRTKRQTGLRDLIGNDEQFGLTPTDLEKARKDF